GEEADRVAGTGRYADALERGRAARAILEGLQAQQPLNTQFKRSLLFALNREGTFLEGLDRRKEAIRAYTEQLRVAREMTQQDPRDRFGQLAFAIASRSVGAALFDDGQTEAGLRALRDARDVVARVIAEDPSNAYARDELGAIDERIGHRLLSLPRAAARTEGCRALADARQVWRT